MNLSCKCCQSTNTTTTTATTTTTTTILLLVSHCGSVYYRFQGYFTMGDVSYLGKEAESGIG